MSEFSIQSHENQRFSGHQKSSIHLKIPLEFLVSQKSLEDFCGSVCMTGSTHVMYQNSENSEHTKKSLWDFWCTRNSLCEFLSVLKNHLNNVSYAASMPPISDEWFLTNLIFKF